MATKQQESRGDMMKISVLYCSLEGVMEALPLKFTRDSTILEVKRNFSDTVDWRRILGDSTADTNIANNFMKYQIPNVVKSKEEIDRERGLVPKAEEEAEI